MIAPVVIYIGLDESGNLLVTKHDEKETVVIEEGPAEYDEYGFVLISSKRLVDWTPEGYVCIAIDPEMRWRVEVEEEIDIR